MCRSGYKVKYKTVVLGFRMGGYYWQGAMLLNMVLPLREGGMAGPLRRIHFSHDFFNQLPCQNQYEAVRKPFCPCYFSVLIKYSSFHNSLPFSCGDVCWKQAVADRVHSGGGGQRRHVPPSQDFEGQSPPPEF